MAGFHPKRTSYRRCPIDNAICFAPDFCTEKSQCFRPHDGNDPLCKWKKIVSTLTGQTRQNGNILRAGLAYKFNWWGPGPVVAKY
jgi:hypothetical protein